MRSCPPIRSSSVSASRLQVSAASPRDRRTPTWHTRLVAASAADSSWRPAQRRPQRLLEQAGALLDSCPSRCRRRRRRSARRRAAARSRGPRPVAAAGPRAVRASLRRPTRNSARTSDSSVRRRATAARVAASSGGRTTARSSSMFSQRSSPRRGVGGVDRVLDHLGRGAAKDAAQRLQVLEPLLQRADTQVQHLGRVLVAHVRRLARLDVKVGPAARVGVQDAAGGDPRLLRVGFSVARKARRISARVGDSAGDRRAAPPTRRRAWRRRRRRSGAGWRPPVAAPAEPAARSSTASVRRGSPPGRATTPREIQPGTREPCGAVRTKPPTTFLPRSSGVRPENGRSP